MRNKPPHAPDGAEEPEIGAATEEEFLAGLGEPDWQEDEGLYELPEFAGVEDDGDLAEEDAPAKPKARRRK